MEEEKHFTAFEADGRLYEFNRIPFGLTNAVVCFQRLMDLIVDKNQLQDTFIYLDNVTICGKSKAQHDLNLEKFHEAAEANGLTYNIDKCAFSQCEINTLGYNIANGTIKPDPERLLPLKNSPVPSDPKSLKRTLGLFSYYSHWIPNFSKKITRLTNVTNFPISNECAIDFGRVKQDVMDACLSYVDENKPLIVETDASYTTIAASLNQQGKPVAFFSRTLTPTERKYSAVEKESHTIVESLRKWRHYLIPRRFKVVTDQRSVSFMLNKQLGNKIKNEKIERWRLELACYNFEIEYRCGQLNTTADTLSRVAALSTVDNLFEIHQSLCHPGIRRLHHYIKLRNLPFSVDDVKRVCRECPVCNECKPRFFENRRDPHHQSYKTI